MQRATDPQTVNRTLPSCASLLKRFDFPGLEIGGQTPLAAMPCCSTNVPRDWRLQPIDPVRTGTSGTSRQLPIPIGTDKCQPETPLLLQLATKMIISGSWWGADILFTFFQMCGKNILVVDDTPARQSVGGGHLLERGEMNETVASVDVTGHFHVESGAEERRR